MKINLRNSLACVCIAATAFSSFAAEPEHIVRSRLEINVTPVALPATKPSERRGLTVKLRSLQSGPAALPAVEVAVFWIGAGTKDTPRTVLAIHRTACYMSARSYSMNLATQDSGLQKEHIEGWVVTARDKTTNELLSVKASSAALETLARTPGALPADPGPVKEKP